MKILFIILLSLAAAINFGTWQNSWSSTWFMFCLLLVLAIIMGR